MMPLRDRLIGWWLDHAPDAERRGFVAYPLGCPWGLGIEVSADRDHVALDVHVLCFAYAVLWEAGYK